MTRNKSCLQQRTDTRDHDNEALAFKPILGFMLARIFNNPQNKEENQSWLEKILQFWGSKDVYDQNSIASFENEMMGGTRFPSAPRLDVLPDFSTFAGSAQLPAKWSDQPEKEKTLHRTSALPQPVPSTQFLANQHPTSVYPPVGQTTFQELC